MITQGAPWGHTQREWGFEVRVDLTDTETGEISNEVFTFDAEPLEVELNALVSQAIARFEQHLASKQEVESWQL